jgi:hypothetical protein
MPSGWNEIRDGVELELALARQRRGGDPVALGRSTQ